MEKERIQELIARFNTGQASEADAAILEKLVEEGTVDLTRFGDLDQLQGMLSEMRFPSPGRNLDDRFYQMLALEKRSGDAFSWKKFFSWPELAPRLAFASVTLLVGFTLGYLIKSPGQAGPEGAQLETVTQQLNDLKEMMMLTLLEKESATERLKAVNLSQEMDDASARVTDALLQTLNNDENVNVRLAALDALKPYARDGKVREELIRSIGKQQSPLVQLALADLMAALQVKSSVKELEKILKSDNTPQDVKDRIKQSIDIII